MELSLKQGQRLGLMTAGVLLGMSAGMGLTNHVHADTTAVPAATVATPTNDSQQATASSQQATASNQSAKKDNDQTFAQQVQDAQEQQSDKSNDSSVDQNQPTDSYKISVDYELEDGTKLPNPSPDTRPDVVEGITRLEGHPYKVGESYSFDDLDPSTWTDYDVIKVVDDQGNKLNVNGKMPAHNLHLHVIVAPTGDRTVFNDDFHKALVKYTQKHGLPAHIQHQANGGLTPEQIDADTKKAEEEDQHITDELNKQKNHQHDNQTSDTIGNTTDDYNNGSSQGNNGNQSDSIHTGTDIGKGSSNSNQKKVTLTFDIMYNGRRFGQEVLHDQTPGAHYSDAALEQLQAELKSKHMTLTPDSLKLINGTVPNSDHRFVLNVEKMSADGDSPSSGEGDKVNDAVTSSLGQNGTHSTSGNTEANDGQDNGNQNVGTPAEYPNGRGTDNGANAGNTDNNGSQQSNQQSLPQTGSISPVAQAGLIMLGVASLGMGGALLKRY